MINNLSKTNDSIFKLTTSLVSPIFFLTGQEQLWNS
jgi:hypothetical protein